MKKIILVTVTILCVVVLILITRSGTIGDEPVLPDQREGVAVILTGAAARIPQEAALLEELDRRGQLNNVVFISGVSSGALNSVILNAILSGKMSWDDYRGILFNLKSSDVFVQDDGKIPVNTSPARALFKKIVEDELGYITIGDLPIVTEISITHLQELGAKKEVYRMCSRKINDETDTTLNLVDILMASTAFPVVFPKIRINNVKTIPDLEYIDGGVGDDQLPYHSLLEFERYRGVGVEKVFMVSRKSDNLAEVSEELKGLGIQDNGLFDKLGVSLDAILQKGIIKKLESFASEAPALLPLTYIWIPDFNQNFLMFNFDHLQEQYDLTTQWAQTHDPQILCEYLQGETGISHPILVRPPGNKEQE
jgi:predicted acylesterase/phospholipase RssA